MKAWHQVLIGVPFLILALSLGQGCSSSFLSPQSDSAQAETLSRAKCVPGPGATGSPRTIEEAVALVNSLPRPVSVACVLESLERPLKISLTDNAISGQPAVGARSPRIFILNDKLIMSVATEGLGKELIEFSFLTSDKTSIKAEIEFPVVQTITPQAPYERILFAGGTTCRFCHANEQPEPSIGFAQAFVSQALQPSPLSRVQLSSFKSELAICDHKAEASRCEILKALLGHGEVVDGEFPAAMPSF